MRKKQLRLIVTFHTTTSAMAMEKYCLSHDVPGRLIPVPREISAGCGMAWSAPPDAREEIEKLLSREGFEVQQLYEIVV
ncbi:MAG: DUF3343 domain-containing protein [Lachnospiraceae bacterium]|nr:DUF3343 domain-containing protein [Lachnospiraceae bacterium]